MKLGEMQRFKYIPRTHTLEGEYGGYFDKAEDGDFVRFSDALARDAALQERINDAEEVIAWVLNARHTQEDSMWSSRKAQAYFDKYPPVREDEP